MGAFKTQSVLFKSVDVGGYQIKLERLQSDVHLCVKWKSHARQICSTSQRKSILMFRLVTCQDNAANYSFCCRQFVDYFIGQFM